MSAHEEPTRANHAQAAANEPYTPRDAKYGYSKGKLNTKGDKDDNPKVSRGGGGDGDTASDQAYGKPTRNEKRKEVLSAFSGLVKLLSKYPLKGVHFHGDDLMDGAAESIPMRVMTGQGDWGTIGYIELTHGTEIHKPNHLLTQAKAIYHRQFPPQTKKSVDSGEQESETAVSSAAYCNLLVVGKSRFFINAGFGDSDDELCVDPGTHSFRNP